MTIRACYFDVDATLVGADRRIPPGLGKVLARCRDRGVHLGLATGRMFDSARPFAEAIRADAPLILYNGGRIQEPVSGRVLFERSLDLDAARGALDLVYRFGLHVNLYLDDTIYIDRESEISRESSRKDGVTQRPVGDLRVFLDRNPTKLLIIGGIGELDRLQAEFGSRPGRYVAVRSERTYLEILPEGVSKGAALEEVSRITGWPLGEVAAFGDSNNDLEMIQVAGHGVAVANALDNVKAVADHVCGADNGLGVAQALRELVLEET